MVIRAALVVGARGFIVAHDAGVAPLVEARTTGYAAKLGSDPAAGASAASSPIRLNEGPLSRSSVSEADSPLAAAKADTDARTQSPSASIPAAS